MCKLCFTSHSRVVCTGQVVPFLHVMHRLNILRRMIHTSAGTLLLMLLLLMSVGGSYFAYWFLVMRHSQKRMQLLEPGVLGLLLLDLGLVGFTKSAAKMFSQRCIISFYVWKPEHWQVQAFVALAILFYPVAYVIFAGSLIYRYTVGHSRHGKSASLTQEDHETENDPKAGGCC